MEGSGRSAGVLEPFGSKGRYAMSDRSFLSWPFFEERHRELADALDVWAAAQLGGVDHSDTDAACRALVAMLGDDGWLVHSGAQGDETLDVRSLCLIRETLARHDGRWLETESAAICRGPSQVAPSSKDRLNQMVVGTQLAG